MKAMEGASRCGYSKVKTSGTGVNKIGQGQDRARRTLLRSNDFHSWLCRIVTWQGWITEKEMFICYGEHGARIYSMLSFASCAIGQSRRSDMKCRNDFLS